MEESLISVIIPVFNVEKYLVDCIESIMCQTYKNIEILLIDDGSTDKSGEICDAYKMFDDRIKVFHKDNEGLGLTRNYGIDRAGGKYIVFVDSDDYLSHDAIELLEKNSKDYDTVIAGYTKVKNSGKKLYVEKYNKEIFINDDVVNKLLPRFIGSLPGIKDSIFTTVCAKLYSTELIKENKIKFKSERKFQSEDLGFQFDYFLYSKNVCVIDESIYYYRFNPNSLTTLYKENRFDETIKVYKYINETIKSLKLPEEAYLRNKKMLFVQVRACLSQESKKISKKNRDKRYESIKKIIENEVLCDAINNYPIELLNFKQKLFINLIKNKKYNQLQLLIDIGFC